MFPLPGGYGIGACLAFTTLAWAARAALAPLLDGIQPFAFFYLSVALTGWFCGIRLAVAAMILGLVVGTGFFLEPHGLGLGAVAQGLVYASVCACLIELVRRARRSETEARGSLERILADGDARRDAEEALRATEQHVRLLLDAAAEAIFGLDTDGRCTFINPAGARMFGYDRADELLGGDMHTLVHHSREDHTPNPRDTCPILRTVEGGEPAHVRHDVFWRKDGSSFPVEYWAHPVRQGGRLVGAVVSMLDVTELRSIERALVEDIRKRRRSEEALREATTLLSAISDHTGDVIFAKDREGRITFANPATLALIGKPLDQVLGKTDLELLQDEAAARAVMANDRRIMDAAVAEDLEEDVPLPDGTKRTWFSRKVPYRDGEGRVIGVLGVARDITQRKEAVASLQRSEEEQRALAEALRQREDKLRELLRREADIRQTLELAIRTGRIGTFESDLVRARHAWSKEARELFGYGTDEAPGSLEGFLRPLHPEDRPRIAAYLLQCFEERAEEFGAEYRTLHPDGTVAWLSARGRVDYGEDGRPLRILGVLVDVTALKESELALARATHQLGDYANTLERTVADRTAQLSETVGELEAFSYSLSHDLRAPLRAMKGFSQILQVEYGEALGAQGGLYLSRIATAAGRLDRLIQDVLTYSRIVREQVELVPIDVEHLAHQLIDENPALQPPRADITIASPLLPMLGHEAYLMQVLSNLVYNAVKFVRHGQLPRVRLRTEADDDSTVRLIVEDDGIGIPRESQEWIFGMFQRMHPDQSYEGTGIGLSIVRKSVERMGGRVGVDSEPGRGSRFWVQLRRP